MRRRTMKNVTLEMSIKPFFRKNAPSLEEVAREVFLDWMPLYRGGAEPSVMLWTADGSELLDYRGRMEDTFEWCYHIGGANNYERPHPHTDPDGIGLHSRSYPYTENVPAVTYGDLKEIVATLKRVGREILGVPVSVGTTMDVGPEFAISDFKYRRHREICMGNDMGEATMVCAYATLHGDDVAYAGFPEGIPEGLPFGTFLGRQTRHFLKDMDMDYIWFSNGLGFGMEPWSPHGALFDGESFSEDRIAEVREKSMEFWRLFRRECPDVPIRTRGTNLTLGIDMASDGVPLWAIYREVPDLLPPPNSPWAAINRNLGLELMGHMTRICELPCDDFMFRYYIHDPWFANSPWYDRYNQSAHDIYLPMAVSRIDENGKVESAGMLNILTIDNSFGDMPDCCVNEPLPHLLKAEKDIADKAAPIVWVYPMREYTTSKDKKILFEMYHGDKFIEKAINDGFPLNCVVSTDNFLKHPLKIYKSSILVSPIPETAEVAEKLKEFELAGGNVIYYGSEERGQNLYSREHFVNFADSVCNMRKLLKRFGYCIEFESKTERTIPNVMTIPSSNVMTISSVNNGLMFSAHSPNFTTDTLLKFPLGAPILTGTDTEIRDGYSVYRFGSCEHRECRVFVKQKSGVVTLKEVAPTSVAHHRKLYLLGLEDATVCIFPENRKEMKVDVSTSLFHDAVPEYDYRFARVEDERYGIYYKGESISGDYMICLP
jgi:hypothetical protein